MWQYFEAKNVLITGASGFLGTALVYRILTKAPIAHIYLITRGGQAHLFEQWSKWLPPSVMKDFLNPAIITVMEGDILKNHIGLGEKDRETLRRKVHVIIHAASSITLSPSLFKVSDSIIQASVRVATYALKFENFERFVYVSTAYANTHLYQESHLFDVPINESIYPLSAQTDRTSREFEDIVNHLSPLELKEHDFPWPYAYCKHLTERLLIKIFENSEKLLILRPSVVGPAQNFPFPGFCVPMSSPCTVAAASLALTPEFTMKISTRSLSPETEATADEVPVDVVVDRLLFHLAQGTSGPVHAVSGVRGRIPFRVFWEQSTRTRRIPWQLRPRWTRVHWHSSELHPISALYVLIGCSFLFSEEKTCNLLGSLGENYKSELQLFTTTPGIEVDFATRSHHVRYCKNQISGTNIWTWILAAL
ncbi:unnamed protein product [Penicillium salamii]|uniref:Fatty acyl-CoA reductase n=1 Tax=Penicillium salamii TaxID=1612424 RepID=A0A9W4ILS3_9EURO|nr:unnamed protein product [Penicillium salamii]